jgi:iron complex transport system substrate-binding protein
MKRLAFILLIASLPAPAHAGAIEWLAPAGPPAGKLTSVVSLAPSITEMIFAVGAGGLVQGVTRYDDWPPEVQKVRRVGGYLDVDIEAVLALKPGAVFCEPNSGIKNIVTRLAGAGIPVGVVRTTDTASIFSAIEEVGAAVGRLDEGRKTAAALRGRLAALQKRIAGRAPAPVLLFYNVQPLMAAGNGSFADEALRIAGGNNLAGGSPVMYPVYDIEKVTALDPAVVIDQSESTMGAAGLSGSPSTFWKKWPDLRAVKTGRVVTIPGGYLFRPGPRIVDSIEMIARLLHPEAFK